MNCLLCKNIKTTKYNKINIEDIWHCNNCDLLFVTDNNSISYDSFYKNKRIHQKKLNELRSSQYKIDYEHLMSYLKNGAVLDIGCSTGDFLSLFDKSIFNCHGIDLDVSAINVAKENYPWINFSHTNLRDFNTANIFDAIIFRGTLQYLGSYLREEFNKAYSLLKTNGYIFIYSLPNKDSFMFHLLNEKWNLFNPKEHKLFFNEKSIKQLANTFKLNISEISYPYLDTAYSDIYKDYNMLIEMIKTNNLRNIPFWGNIMQVVLQKK